MDIDFFFAMCRSLAASEGKAGYYDLPPEDIQALSSRRSWRVTIWQRDNGQCHVCGRHIPLNDWYECGHIVDRVNGGINHPSNLVVMCRPCNQLKPGHATRAEYLQWIADGAWMAALIAEVEEKGTPWPPEWLRIIG
jgi:hypothetical protein